MFLLLPIPFQSSQRDLPNPINQCKSNHLIPFKNAHKSRLQGLRIVFNEEKGQRQSVVEGQVIGTFELFVSGPNRFKKEKRFLRIVKVHLGEGLAQPDTVVIILKWDETYMESNLAVFYTFKLP